MSSPATTWKKISRQTHATWLIFENQENNPLPQEHCVLCNIIQTYVHKLHDICTWIHDNHFPYNHWWFDMIMSKNNLCLIPRDTRYPQFTKNKIYANIQLHVMIISPIITPISADFHGNHKSYQQYLNYSVERQCNHTPLNVQKSIYKSKYI
jgi:hypothetical protein